MISNLKLRTTIMSVRSHPLLRTNMVDEKAKQQVDSKQYSLSPSHGVTVPTSPSTSVFFGPSLPGTSQHMSPVHCLPTGLANAEKPETIPEIQMPSMAALDPYYLQNVGQVTFPCTALYTFDE